MYLNEYGVIVQQQWEWLQEQYPYVESHAFVMMPNHIHGILEISRSLISGHQGDISDTDNAINKIKSVSELMGAYKMTCSKLIRQLQNRNGYENPLLPTFTWQRSFHDHIITSQISYLNILHYIRHNPAKWEDDEFFK